MTQPCQLRATVTGQTAAGIGAAVGMAQKWAGSNGDDRRAEAAVKSPASLRPLLKRQESSLPRHEDDTPVSVPRTTRARATDAPRVARPVALTPWQSKRHLWQARRASFHLRHDNRVKKGAPPYLNSYPFLLLFLSLATGIGKGDISERIFLGEGSGPRAHY
jgi:hypothetical protein